MRGLGAVPGTGAPPPGRSPGGRATVVMAAVANGNRQSDDADSFSARRAHALHPRLDKTFIYFISRRVTGSYGRVAAMLRPATAGSARPVWSL